MTTFIKIQPGYRDYKVCRRGFVEVVDFDPTQISIFLMPVTGGSFYIAAPPDSDNPSDYLSPDYQEAYRSMYTLTIIKDDPQLWPPLLRG